MGCLETRLDRIRLADSATLARLSDGEKGLGFVSMGRDGGLVGELGSSGTHVLVSTCVTHVLVSTCVTQVLVSTYVT